MAAPIPTLGYRSRTAACIALRDQGLTDAAIADRIGIDEKRVAALLYGADNPARYCPKSKKRHKVMVRATTLDALARHAHRRGETTDRLAARILDTVTTENLIDAVLDDGGTE